MRQYFNYSLFVVGCFFILWRFLSFWSVFGCTLLCNHRFFAQSGTSSNFPRNKIALARIAQAKSYSLTNHFSFNRHAISLALDVFWLYTALRSSFFAQSGTSSNFPRNKIALARIAQAKSYSLTNHFSFNRHAISLALVVFWLYTALQSSFFAQLGISSNFLRNKIALARIAQAKSYSLTNPFLFYRHAIST